MLFRSQPRLDWQLWFAALEGQSRNPWFGRLLQRLLENSPEVIALLETTPFPNKPPHYVRALLYDYRYSSEEEKAQKGLWWQRKLTGLYFPAVELKRNNPSRNQAPSSLEGMLRPRQP